jgi:glycosyltransferase involved in cell wall biosynthesis
MNLVHLTSSTFFGGPERQMLGLAENLPDTVHTTFISFREGGRCESFLKEVRGHGFETHALTNDFPKLRTTARELAAALHDCDLLLCHGYKANILGRIAARRNQTPCVSVSRGWTGENHKVKAYEWLDRRHLRFMDRVVCVSDGQAAKVRRWCGVPEKRIAVIRNSARLSAFENTDPDARRKLRGLLPSDTPVSRIVVAAGRLSPEKGFSVLIDAAARVSDASFVLFGEGTLRPELERRVAELGLANRFVLPGFRSDLDSLIAAADVVTLPSLTEGLPNVALEASAAGVPVVATAVGGTPEVIADGETGLLLAPGDSAALAHQLNVLLNDAGLRARFGAAGRTRMHERFTFEAQAAAYMKLFDEVLEAAPRAVLA